MPFDDALGGIPHHLVEEAHSFDAADPLRSFRDDFVLPDGVLAYLDGNSLGRPLKRTAERLTNFVGHEWGERLIRSWDERWMDRPIELGDTLGHVVLGAGAGQTVIADSTTVLLYKLIRAAVDARPGRTEIIADTENFPTDRYILDGVAKEAGLTIRWITPDPASGVQVEQVETLLSERTALVSLSHVAYKSAYIADLPTITALAHDVGALALWDLCHSAGALDLDLDAAGVDLAVGCTYKYLNGGPGAPAFAYVASRLQSDLRQPIPGWMGHADPFAMGPTYEPAPDIRRFISGTPPILAMLPMEDMLKLIGKAGMQRVREKSVKLTDFTVKVADEVLAPLGVTVASPRNAQVRGGHVTLEHPAMDKVVSALWKGGIIPDFRPPQGLRAGLSPLSTSFAELVTALAHVRRLL